MLTKAALGTLVVFVISSTWLYLAWTHGNRSNEWPAVPVQVIDNDVERSYQGRPRGWSTTVNYIVGGVEYQATVDEYLLGKSEIYVNPNDPMEVVGKRGASIQSMGRPLVGTVGSGLFAIVLILIVFSPKEDD